MKLTSNVGAPYLPAQTSVRLVGVVVGVNDIPSLRLPLRLIIVVDKSESMMLPMVTKEQLEDLQRRGIVRQTLRDGITVWEYSGEYLPELTKSPRGIDFVKEAIKQIVERLTDDDQFALVCFASSARTVIPLSVGNKRASILKELDSLESLELGKETKLSLGLQEALTQIQNHQTIGSVNRIVVLTDGFAQDEKDCYAIASQANVNSTSISTLGLSAQFNDELMTSLADRTGGNAEWVPDSSQISKAMAEEFERARRVGAPQAQFLLKLSQGVEVRRAYKLKPVLAPIPAQVLPETIVSLSLGDIAVGQTLQLLVEFLAPPRPEGVFRIAQAFVQWHTKAGLQKSSTLDILVTYTNDSTKLSFIDPVVARAMEAVTASDLQTRALRELQMGQLASATKKLESAATRLLNLGESEKAKQTINLAKRLKAGEKVEPDQTKRLRYQTRRIS